MARYIDADALIERLGINQDCTECSYCTRKCYCSWNPDPGEICIAISEQPTVTINDTADKIKVTNCNDNISRQAICDALDKAFADRIKMFDYDSYEKADEKTQLVCDGIMKAIDVVLDQPTVDHIAEVSKKGDLISRQALLRQIDIDSDGEPGYYGDTWKFIDTIKNLPSAQPERPEQPDTAKRIIGRSRDGMTFWCQCDMCNEPVDVQDNYCRGCGRRLINE